jgi:hypothetical protein
MRSRRLQTRGPRRRRADASTRVGSAGLLRSVPWLRFENCQRWHTYIRLYIRPKGEHSPSLVDDLTTDSWLP